MCSVCRVTSLPSPDWEAAELPRHLLRSLVPVSLCRFFRGQPARQPAMTWTGPRVACERCWPSLSRLPEICRPHDLTAARHLEPGSGDRGLSTTRAPHVDEAGGRVLARLAEAAGAGSAEYLAALAAPVLLVVLHEFCRAPPRTDFQGSIDHLSVQLPRLFSRWFRSWRPSTSTCGTSFPSC